MMDEGLDARQVLDIIHMKIFEKSFVSYLLLS